MKRKKNLLAILAIVVLLVSACGQQASMGYRDNVDEVRAFGSATYFYMTFEEAVAEFATDIVIAQYVGSKQFNEGLIEHEFIVYDRMLGYAPDTIFVYTEIYTSADVMGIERHIDFNPGNVVFEYGVRYILPLICIASAYLVVQDDAFVLIKDAVIVLDAPEKSTMYGEDLTLHIECMDLARYSSEETIISFVEEIIEEIEECQDDFEIIRSTLVNDIVSNSPHVLLIEVGEPLRLAEEQVITHWGLTDIYYAIVVQSIKGNAPVGSEAVIIFHADTVFSGERHIVAVHELDEGTNWFAFTSGDSLFSVDKLTDILLLVD